MRNLISKLRRFLRGDLPRELVRTRRRFSLLMTALVLTIVACALWASYQLTCSARTEHDSLMMRYSAAQPVAMPEGAERIETGADAAVALNAGEVDEPLDQLFSVVLEQDGSYTPLFDSSRATDGMRESAAKFMDELRASLGGQKPSAEALGVGGLVWSHVEDRSWEYTVRPFTSAELSMTDSQAEDSADAAGSLTAALPDDAEELYLVVAMETTARERGFQALARQDALIWLASIIPVAAVCYLLSRMAMRPAARAWKQQQRFVVNASHELKTPLASLSASLDALTANGDETVASQRRWCDYLRADIDALARLTYRLLAAAQADAGDSAATGATAEASCDAAEVASAVLERFAARAEARGLTRTLEAEACGKAACPAEALADVLSALVDNAVTFADEGGSVDVTVKPLSRASLAIAVSNSGPGIASEDLPHVFERFWRGDTTRTRETDAGGSATYGLGLPIALARAESFGGTITAASTPGIRTTFTVKVPTR